MIQTECSMGNRNKAVTQREEKDFKGMMGAISPTLHFPLARFLCTNLYK